jgi:peptidoglycan hydrolase CwlO-like protein
MSKQFIIYSLLFMAIACPVFAEEDLSKVCDLDAIEGSCAKTDASQCRQLLDRCEKYYTDQSDAIEKDLDKTTQEKKSLQNKISDLNKKIKNLSYQINQSNLIIKDLGLQITDTELSINKTSLKITDQTKKLAVVLRSMYEEDQKPIVEILFSEDDLSGFFSNLVSLDRLNIKSKELLTDVKTLKINLENQKNSLDQEKGELEKIVEIQSVQKQSSNNVKKEQEYYLKLTEEEYQNYLNQKKTVDQMASEIRARIFELVGVPKAPTFGEAYEIAKFVEGVTGVRPAFLLAVLTQESSLGKNVGQCYLKNSSTGAGEIIKTSAKVSKVMSPGRDVPPFLTITQELGRDSFNTPISCPMSYGWGGAMGPAQFIPSTWMLYRDELKRINGKPADPWDIKDSFLAAALYLADYGAKNQTYNGEFNAALSYFAGPGWSSSRYSGVYKRDYGYPVMATTKGYESDIKEIQ